MHEKPNDCRAEKGKKKKSDSECPVLNIKRMLYIIGRMCAVIEYSRKERCMIDNNMCRRNGGLKNFFLYNIAYNLLCFLLFVIEFNGGCFVFATVFFHFLAAARTLVFCMEGVKRNGC